MVLKIFGKEEEFDNEFVQEVIDRIEEEGYTMEKYDIDSEEAHVQAEIYEIFTTPSFVVSAEDGSEIEAWHGKIPQIGDLMEFMRR